MNNLVDVIVLIGTVLLLIHSCVQFRRGKIVRATFFDNLCFVAFLGIGTARRGLSAGGDLVGLEGFLLGLVFGRWWERGGIVPRPVSSSPRP